MQRLAVTLALLAVVTLSRPAVAQVPPPVKRAPRVRVVDGPRVEIATGHLVVLRWTTNNPGGSDVHYGVVHYGTDRAHLGRTAKSPIRLNHEHPYTTFRVRLDDLAPRTTYYYWVDCEESSGESDGVKGAVHEFTTPRAGERNAAYVRRMAPR
ncbi:MAG TPA: fibronectin type III domain-containing protein [Myxococcales bacterium]